MWEFMTKYAESFWTAGDYAFEVMSVIMAWALTLGLAYFALCIICAIGEMIKEHIEEMKEELKHGQEK